MGFTTKRGNMYIITTISLILLVASHSAISEVSPEVIDMLISKLSEVLYIDKTTPLQLIYHQDDKIGRIPPVAFPIINTQYTVRV
jgi:hypothetical protein